ncbi:MAG TPA: hypothetical protein VFN83_05025 [Gemmatimonadales bacterium]|nr:hypothetical protein [Gemmatimonadales bacterium]
MSLTLSIAAAAAVLAAPVRDTTPPATLTVTVDSARHVITIRSGPYDLPNMPPMTDHAMMDLGMSHDTPVQHFEWPVQGWLRGFRVSLDDGNGHPVPKQVMHHMIMVNFSRRQLVYHAAERLFGAGTETADAVIPATIGVPMSPGMELGMYVAWHNDTGADLKSVYLNLSLPYLPPNQNPRPLNALPIYMDVNLTVGGANTFDVPPGRSEKAHEFTLPISGRLLGVGGHMHDYGRLVRLEDVKTGKVIAEVKTRADKDGKVLGVSRKLFALRGEGIHLEANHPYRVVGVYDNPTGELIRNGAMAHMVGLFVPDDLAKWPAIDPTNPDFERDMASLNARGQGGHDEHEGMDMNMDQGGHNGMNHSGHD